MRPSQMSSRKKSKPPRPIRSLLGKFKALGRSTDRQQRGYAFENILSELFRRNGFEVKKSPASTRPRQTDILAIHPACTIIVSAKWEAEAAGSAAVDSLRNRLEFLPSGAVGCLFSMSDYTQGVADYAADYAASRQASIELLLFSSHEIRMLFAGTYQLTDLIEQKRRTLRTTGKTLFRKDNPAGRESISSLDFPNAGASIHVGSVRADLIATARAGGSHFVYAYDMPEATYGTLGRGVRLELGLPSRSFGAMMEFLHTLPATIGLSENGMFSIHQTHVAWHGFGIKALLREVRRQKQRYKMHPGPFHHSEHCIYFSETRDGWVMLTFQVGVGEPMSLNYCKMEIRLPGIPIDTGPYETLCRQRGHRGSFEIILDEEPEVHRLFLQDGPRLEVRNLITEDRGRVVGALVAKNPFFGGKVPLPDDAGTRSLHFLRSEETIICSVKDMHSPESKFDYYYITEIKVIPMAIREAIEIRCTWNRCLDPRPRPEDARKALRKKWSL